MLSKKIIILLAFVLLSITITAQNADDSVENSYNKALTEYQNGQFERCERHTLTLLPDADGMLKKSSYRLLALCRLEQGDIDGARKYVAALLKYDPYYTPSLGDPLRFIDLIEEKKHEESGVTTASRRQESIDEAPVAVTLITNDMIRRSGAQTLQELLSLYVPGMAIAEGQESNIAMHGVYGLTQEKILFLQDGHRMNSYSTNSEAPDYRSSLDKIDHVEVLRGPASSLYGNIALTAVVNIITHRGAAINGGNISVTGGTQKSLGGSFLAGGGNNIVDVMAWGSLFKTDGFTNEVPNILGGSTTLYSNAYNKRPSYDMGVKAHWRNFTFTATSQRSKRTPYINLLQLSPRQNMRIGVDAGGNIDVIVTPEGPSYDAIQNFDHSQYATIDGDMPGTSRRADNFTIDYSHTFGRVDLHVSAFASLEKSSIYSVIGDSLQPYIADLMYTYVSDLFTEGSSTRGIFFKMNWETFAIGSNVNASLDYNGLGNGSILFGIQYEHFSASSANLAIGGGFNNSDATTRDFLDTDKPEETYSVYAQLKHYFLPQLILNAGLRCDHKVRFNDNTMTHLSPRLSLIYKFGGGYSARLSYNHSFVDAPYLYRASKMNAFTGNEDLNPERLSGFQGGVMYHKPNSAFTAEVSCFYNTLEDIVQLNYANKSGQLFVNAMKMKQTGVDAAMQYTTPRLLLTANATWQRVFDDKTAKGFKGSSVYNGNTFSTPSIMMRTVAAYCPYKGAGKGFINGGALWVNATVEAQTATYCKNTDLLSTMMSMDTEICDIQRISPRCNIGIGATYEWKHLDIDLRVKNITDNRYAIGSMLSFGTPHAGRQFIAKARVKL